MEMYFGESVAAYLICYRICYRICSSTNILCYIQYSLTNYEAVKWGSQTKTLVLVALYTYFSWNYLMSSQGFSGSVLKVIHWFYNQLNIKHSHRQAFKALVIPQLLLKAVWDPCQMCCMLESHNTSMSSHKPPVCCIDTRGVEGGCPSRVNPHQEQGD